VEHQYFGLTPIPLLWNWIIVLQRQIVAGWALAGGGGHHLCRHTRESANLFQPISLFNVILMLAMFAAGLGLMARAVKSS
jgi:hypothetical protein